MSHYNASSPSLACHTSAPDNLWAACTMSEHLSAIGPCPELEQFSAQILPRCPRYILASQTIRSNVLQKSSSLMRLQDGIVMPWMCPNTNDFVNALTFDIDHTHAHENLLEIPQQIRPTLIEDPVSGRAHAILFLNSPVYIGENSRQKPQNVLWLAHHLLATSLGATPLPYKSLIKSPWGLIENLIGSLASRTQLSQNKIHSTDSFNLTNQRLLWKTQPGSGPVELRDIVSLLKPKWHEKIPKRKNFSKGCTAREPSALGRNCCLFDKVRWWCYKELISDLREICTYAHHVNRTFSIALPKSEVDATARSICKFMNSRYRPLFGTRHARMTFSRTNLTTVQKQAESGARTAALKKKKTHLCIENALKNWPLRQPLTQDALAEATGLNERTIRRYWHMPWPTGLSLLISGSKGDLAGSVHPSRHLQTLKDLAQVYKTDCLWLASYANHVASQKKNGARPCFPQTPDDWSNPEVAISYRQAEEAAENATRRQKNRRKRQERQKLHTKLEDAGRNNAITIFLTEIKQQKAVYDKLIQHAEQEKWNSESRAKLHYAQRASQKSIRRAFERGKAARLTCHKSIP